MLERKRITFRFDHGGFAIFARVFATSIALALLVSMLVVVPGSARAASIIEVDDNAVSSWYDATHVRTINEAINNATSGDGILVHPGTYSESVMVNKRVSIYSKDGAAATTVTSGAARAIYVTASDSNITGFTITGGASTGISVDLHRVAIRECVITGVQRGLEIKGQYATVVGCAVTGYQTNGIYVLDAIRRYVANNPARWAAERENLAELVSRMRYVE